MNLHFVDIVIIIAYMLATVLLGVWLSGRASKNMKSYFLGGNEIPWYMLGLSNASGMFDISGTMWMVYLLFVYGLKSVWIPWLWPVFNQIFLMVYLSVWLRRSGVMTGAEWIKFRFGDGKGAILSHLVVVAFAIINVIGFLAYGFVGIGKFAAAFIPFQLAADPVWNANLYGLIIVALTTIYVVKGGMMSVVFTEVLQFVVMTIACIWVGIIGMQQVSPDLLANYIPEGWSNIFFGWHLNLDWSNLMAAANTKIVQDGYDFFGFFFMMMLFKGVLQSMAGPAPNYDMQRILSAKTPREAAKMSGFVNVVLIVPRYMLVTGMTILALVFFTDQLNAMGAGVDFELVLPFVIREFLPVGLVGILLAALLAAFMSTYAATVNAAPAYIVNDIYKRFINDNATDKKYIYLSYATSLIVVVIGTVIGLFVTSLNDLIQWIVAALYGGYTAANLLKWHWWRFNSYGFFWGMLSGIVSSMTLPLFFPEYTMLYIFPGILAVSVAGCVFGSLLTPADDEDVLIRFYLKVRPWGFWKPIHEAAERKYGAVEANKDLGRDMFNVVVGTIWQTSLTAAGIFLVIQQFTALAICAAIAIVTSLILKFNWFDKMQDFPLMPKNFIDDSPEEEAQTSLNTH